MDVLPSAPVTPGGETDLYFPLEQPLVLSLEPSNSLPLVLREETSAPWVGAALAAPLLPPPLPRQWLWRLPPGPWQSAQRQQQLPPSFPRLLRSHCVSLSRRGRQGGRWAPVSTPRSACKTRTPAGVPPGLHSSTHACFIRELFSGRLPPCCFPPSCAR